MKSGLTYVVGKEKSILFFSDNFVHFSLWNPKPYKLILILYFVKINWSILQFEWIFYLCFILKYALITGKTLVCRVMQISK